MKGGLNIRELYIFDQDDKLLTILSTENGLISAPFRDELNQTSDTPLQFTVDAQAEYKHKYNTVSNTLTQVASSFIGAVDSTSTDDELVNVSPAQFIKEENRVVFKDREGNLREFVIKEIDDVNNIDGPETTATCIPSFVEELNNKIVVERRFTDREAQFVLDAALQGTRFIGVVDVSLGLASTSFYYQSSLEAIYDIKDNWGGDLRDIVYLSNDETHIERREIHLKQRLGADNGLRFESDHNIEEIERTVLSYPYTALYGRGSSLEIEDEEGELTGGHTRYIGFDNVVWKKSSGDPVDKPLGQKWVGDPDALAKYGYEKNGQLLHLEGIFSNQDYEDESELLYATWEHLQKVQHPEINYRLSVDLLDKEANLGDSAIAIDREFARPIEVQSRVIAVEYDLVDIDNTTIVEIGQFIDLDDSLRSEVDDLKDRVNRPIRPIDADSFPDKKPSKPTNLIAIGGFQVIQLHWQYTDEVFVKHYEVYGSQVADFVPDSQNLLFRGQVSAFAHEVETDETWYYYVRAVNYHSLGSDYSNRVSASTVRILTPDILFGEDMAQELRDLNEVSDIIGDGNIDIGNLHSDLPNYFKQQAKEYTDLEILEVENQLKDKLNSTDFDLFRGDYTDIEHVVTDVDDRFGRRINETNVRIDNLDIRGTNFISHLPENWEKGFWSIADGGGKVFSNTAIRLKERIPLSHSEEFTLTTYGNYQLTLRLFDKDDLFVKSETSEADNSVTFTTGSNVRFARIYITTTNTTNSDIEPNQIVDDLKVKLSLGGTSSGWTPNLDDTGQLVANVQTYASDFEQTKNMLSNKIESVETNIGGFTEANYINDVSYFEQRFDNINLSVRNVQIGGRNMLWYTDLAKEDNLSKWIAYGKTKSKTITSAIRGKSFIRMLSDDVVVAGDSYTLRSNYMYSLQKGKEYTISWQGATSDFAELLRVGFLVDGVFYKTFTNSQVERRVEYETDIYGYRKPLYHYSVSFESDEEVEDLALFFRFEATSSNLNWAFVGYQQLEEGGLASSHSLNVDEVTQRMSIAESQINVNAANIDLKVDVDNVVSEINLKKEGVRISGDLIHLDGLTLIDSGIIKSAHIGDTVIERAHLKRAIIDDVHIEKMSGSKIIAKSVIADKLDVANLSAITANLGTVTAGILNSSNDNFYLNLNTGELNMKNANFTLGNGADIEFGHYGNRLYYNIKDTEGSRLTRSSGMGVGRSINNRFPYAFLGTSTGFKPHPQDGEYFTGFIANTNARMDVDEIGNSAVGRLFHVRDKVVSFTKGFTFDLTGSSNFRFRPMYSGNHTYHLGADNNQFHTLYAERMRTSKGYLRFESSSVNSQGFRMDTNYDGDPQLYFRGIHSGEYFSLGRPGGWRFRYVYLTYQPDVSSDERLKTGIKEVDKASDIVHALQPIKYRFKLSNKDLELKNEGNLGRGLNPTQYGFSAQHTKQVLDDLGITDQSLVNLGEDNYYGMQTNQIIPLLVKTLQEEKQRNDSLENRLEAIEAKLA